MLKQANEIDRSLLTFTNVIASLAALMIAVSAPALNYWFGQRYHHGSVVKEAEYLAATVSQMIGRNPRMWEFENERIAEVLRNAGAEAFETRSVIAGKDALIASHGVDKNSMSSPFTFHSAPLFDAGLEVGRVEVARSMRPLLVSSLWLFLGSSLAAGGAYFGFRSYLLRLLRQAMRQASYLASHDPLTNLPNRALFNEWMIRAVRNVRRDGVLNAVLLVDLDQFKEVNDIFGHAAGDELLVQATARMQVQLADDDVIARLGGDEFAIIQKNCARPEDAAALAQCMITTLSQPFMLLEQKVGIGASVGISLIDRAGATDVAEITKQADMALYRAKSDGRGIYQFYKADMNRRLLERRKLERELRVAIEQGQFELHYQPQVSHSSHAIVGVEALLRWRHPEHGYIPPENFIPLTEETGLILPLGKWILETACRDALAWPELRVAVNISPVQFKQWNLIRIVGDALKLTGLPPDRLELEITESLLLDNTDEVIGILSELRGMGVRIAMDDFGAGYASLNYLRRFAFDKIKIDKSFTDAIGADDGVDSIVTAILSMGRALGMRLNAEGVETSEQARILEAMGCEELQGFHFGKAVTCDGISFLLDAEGDLVSMAALARETAAPEGAPRAALRGAT